MGLLKCKDCDGPVSSQAPNCPHCGAPVTPSISKQLFTGLGSIIRIIILLFLVVFGVSVFYSCSLMEQSSRGERSHASPAIQEPPAVTCNLSDIEIKSISGSFIDECQSTSCPRFKGTATLINKCKMPVGIQVKIIAYNKAGIAIQTNEKWPASIRNIPPGEYPFSMDYWLQPDSDIDKYALQAIDLKRW